MVISLLRYKNARIVVSIVCRRKAQVYRSRFNFAFLADEEAQTSLPFFILTGTINNAAISLDNTDDTATRQCFSL